MPFKSKYATLTSIGYEFISLLPVHEITNPFYTEITFG